MICNTLMGLFKAKAFIAKEMASLSKEMASLSKEMLSLFKEMQSLAKETAFSYKTLKMFMKNRDLSSKK